RLPTDDDVKRVDRDVVLPHVVEALRRTGVVVECDAGRNDVDKRRAAMLKSRLDQRHELSLVAGKAAGDERGAELDRHADEIDRLVQRVGALFALRSAVSGGRELP